MADPSVLINSVPIRLIVDHAGFPAARSVLRHASAPFLLPRRARRALASRVRGHLEMCFPGLGAKTWTRLTREYMDHLSWRYAEDAIILGQPSVAHHLDLISRYVSFSGAEHWEATAARPEGVLLVGSHVGTPALGTTAVLSRYLHLPAQRRPTVRLCADPEMTRYPRALRRLEEAWDTHGIDAKLLVTRRPAEEILSEMDRVLRQGGVVTTNLDVVKGGRSRRVFSLFGRVRLRLPALVAAARTALATGAIILPWTAVRLPHRFMVLFEPPIGPFSPVPRARLVSGHPGLENLCDRLAHQLQAWIRAWPAQWSYWDRLHRRILGEVP